MSTDEERTAGKDVTELTAIIQTLVDRFGKFEVSVNARLSGIDTRVSNLEKGIRQCIWAVLAIFLTVAIHGAGGYLVSNGWHRDLNQRFSDIHQRVSDIHVLVAGMKPSTSQTIAGIIPKLIIDLVKAEGNNSKQVPYPLILPNGVNPSSVRTFVEINLDAPDELLKLPKSDLDFTGRVSPGGTFCIIKTIASNKAKEIIDRLKKSPDCRIPVNAYFSIIK